ncbi:LysR family transcriptional regulator [Roseivivax marinus]|uniref:LysR family transcriptional regulator n=1 Tax=Roseivivax marinus TaxID=1379903 RepID=W4HLW1_9RHOB|nr:LysR substrate-binding domain-containing protein [Roseivivax marinus]ETW13767.1 LysR family transcriptional regulator [Roseivivax marinus]UMA65349.1 LysR substrate-binding domain-containing protein [Roseivivax marinus]SEL63230.1 DNA-binding transcriptional regulator, LysR family [Roseivivax marinus]
MDTRQLKTLVAIAEHGTFSRAAERVLLTPSAVSQQIHALEQEVGVPLFNREKRPPTLNLQGLQLLETAKQILGLVDEVKGAIEGKRTTGTLNIGAVRTSAIGLLPRAIVGLREEYPEVRFKLHVGLSSTLISDVLAGRLDLAIVAEHVGVPQTLTWAPFLREPLVVAAPSHARGMTAREMLTDLPYLRFRSNVPLANLIDTELARLNIVTEDIAEIDTVAALVECVVAGLGASIVPDIAVPKDGPEIVTQPFGTPQIFRQIGIVQRASSAKSELMRDLHNLLAVKAGPFGVPLA